MHASLLERFQKPVSTSKLQGIECSISKASVPFPKRVFHFQSLQFLDACQLATAEARVDLTPCWESDRQAPAHGLTLDRDT
jgi:hypothetical protein